MRFHILTLTGAILCFICVHIQISCGISIGELTHINNERKFVSCLRQDEFNSSRLLVCTYTSLETYDLETNTFSLIAGTTDRERGYHEGPASQARFYDIYDVVQLNDCTMIVSDYRNHCLRKVTESMTSPFAGQCTQPGYTNGLIESEAQFNGPQGLALSWVSLNLFVVDTLNYAFRRIDIGTGFVTTLVQSPMEISFESPQYITCDQNAECGIFYATASHSGLLEVNTTTGQITPLLDTSVETQDGNSLLPISPTKLLYGSSSLYMYDLESGVRDDALSFRHHTRAMSCASRSLYLWAAGRGMYKANLFGISTESICYY